MSKHLKFNEGDKVVINTKSTDLLSLNETVAEITYVLPESNYHDYKIKYKNDFGNDSTIRVKENEIQRIKDELILQLEVGQKVIYTPLDVTVTIEQINLIYGQVAIRFPDGGVQVVGMEVIKGEGEKMVKELELVAEFGTDSELNLVSSEKELTDKELHRKTIEEIHHTYKIKNADYGNSFGDQFNEHGLLSAVIRLDDKMRRLKQLNKQEAQVKDESIRDTVLDLANYAIMTVMELDKANN